MKKFLPTIILAMGFFGFLATQILWNSPLLNAQQVKVEKSKDQLFESLFQESKFQTIDQKNLELKTLQSPVVVVNFWASWCLPCLKEFPSLTAFQKKFGEKASIVGINGDEEDPLVAIEKTKKKYGLDFHHVIDPMSEISDKFLVAAYPFSLVYVKGKLVHTSNKGHDFMAKDFIAKVEDALKGK
jgi:thiol-disulfide isomerase/thioredoxin